jgi:hypothetical protein
MVSLAALCLAAASCTVVEWRDSHEGDIATVTFHLRTPSRAKGAAATRAFPDDFEDRIDDITVFLAHSSGGNYVMESMVSVNEFRPVSTTTQTFTISLPPSTVSTKLFVVANLMDADNGLSASYGAGFTAANGKGLPEADFIRMLADDWAAVAADAQGTGAVCMYMAGSVELPSIEAGEVNLHIPLLRWVARADVNVDLAAGSMPFEPTCLSVWHGYLNAGVLAGDGAYDPDNATRVVQPTIADTERLADGYSVPVTVSGTAGLVATAYVGEQDGRTTYAEKLDATCLILGGYFNGSTTESFYRVDFDSRADGHPFGQVLRNWRYVFNVTGVSTEGYATAAEAAVNPAHSIAVEVEMWDENVQQVNFVDTGDYIYASTLDVAPGAAAGAQRTFSVRSTVPFTWGFDGSDAEESSSDATLANADYSVAITVRDAQTGYTDYTFTVTAPGSGTGTSAIVISARGATMRVGLRRDAGTTSIRAINVLSLTDGEGSTGILSGNPTTDTPSTPMRTILADPLWFGPSGLVRCGGFTFDRFATGALTPASAVDAAAFGLALDKADILIAPCGSDPPQTMVDMIVDWAADPHHVLFVSADAATGAAATNVLLRGSLAGGLSWYPISTLNIGSVYNSNTSVMNALGSDYLAELSGLPAASIHFVSMISMAMATMTDDNRPFIGGPFGMPEQGFSSPNISGNSNTVDADYPYRMWDDVASGAVPAVGSGVTPLAVFRACIGEYSYVPTSVFRTRAMLIGVDKGAGVVYLGESQSMTEFLGSAPPGNASGPASTPYYNSLTKLMSNIWAWAVETVLS